MKELCVIVSEVGAEVRVRITAGGGPIIIYIGSKVGTFFYKHLTSSQPGGTAWVQRHGPAAAAGQDRCSSIDLGRSYQRPWKELLYVCLV